MWVDIRDSVSWSHWVLYDSRTFFITWLKSSWGFPGSGDLKPKGASLSLVVTPRFWRSWLHQKWRCGLTHASFTHWLHTNPLIGIPCALVFCCWTFLLWPYYASMPLLLDVSAQTILLSFISLTVASSTPLVLLRITPALWRCRHCFEGKPPKLQCVGESPHQSINVKIFKHCATFLFIRFPWSRLNLLN